MQLDMVLLPEYLLWHLGRLCRLLFISLSPQVCCRHLSTLCYHTAEADMPLSGHCQIKRSESCSCVCNIDFVFQEQKATTNPGLDGKISKTELELVKLWPGHRSWLFGKGEAALAAAGRLWGTRDRQQAQAATGISCLACPFPLPLMIMQEAPALRGYRGREAAWLCGDKNALSGIRGAHMGW